MPYKKRMIWSSGYAIDVAPVRPRLESTTNAATADAQPYLGEGVYLVDEASNTYAWNNTLLKYVPEQLDSDAEGLEIRVPTDLLALMDTALGGTAWRSGASTNLDGGTPTSNYTSTIPIDGGAP
jgi:hypothetical protein